MARPLFYPQETTYTVNGHPLFLFDRRPLDRDDLVGFVMDANDELTLIQVLDTAMFRLNGYTVFRNADIRRCRTVANDEFDARAAKLNRVKPVKPAGLNIGSMTTAIETAGAAFPLITLHPERVDKGACYIGRFISANTRSVIMQDVSPQAEWGGQQRFPAADVTRLEFGGAYETLLAKMAPKP
jgi:hypothetical protein